MQHSFYKVKKEHSVLFSIYIYIYISIYIYIYLYISIYIYIYIYIYLYIYIEKKNATFCVLLQKNETFLCSFTFFAKERNVLCILFLSCKRMLHSLHSFTFLRKECERMHRSFGTHKSPKTQKKNVKECCILQKNAKERCVQNGKERGAQP